MALVLTRRPEEVINMYVGGQRIQVTITNVDRDRGCCRVAIDAPMSVDIVRGEIDPKDPVHFAGEIIPDNPGLNE